MAWKYVIYNNNKTLLNDNGNWYNYTWVINLSKYYVLMNIYVSYSTIWKFAWMNIWVLEKNTCFATAGHTWCRSTLKFQCAGTDFRRQKLTSIVDTRALKELK